jgi:uncharacterized protein (TIGR02145 family)
MSEPSDFELGEVGFARVTTWSVGDQIWSDVVVAANCNKTDFNGGGLVDSIRMHVFRADCRSVSAVRGSMFSWEMVNQFGDLLCPHPWRVPTRQDFMNLDTALGGSGKNSFNHIRRETIWDEEQEIYRIDTVRVWQEVLSKYTGTTWGGVYTGRCGADGGSIGRGTIGTYWSQSEFGPGGGFYLLYTTTGHIAPQGSELFGRSIGRYLRCVKDKGSE